MDIYEDKYSKIAGLKYSVVLKCRWLDKLLNCINGVSDVHVEMGYRVLNYSHN